MPPAYVKRIACGMAPHEDAIMGAVRLRGRVCGHCNDGRMLPCFSMRLVIGGYGGVRKSGI